MCKTFDKEDLVDFFSTEEMFLSALHICRYDNCSGYVGVYVYTIYCDIKTKSTDAVN